MHYYYIYLKKITFRNGLLVKQDLFIQSTYTENLTPKLISISLLKSDSISHISNQIMNFNVADSEA